MVTQAARREATRSGLLKAARKLFLKHGYEATTTQMILEAAGVSKGAMYHHFASKYEIIEAIYTDTSKTAIDGALKDVDPQALPLDRLRQSSFNWLAEIRNKDITRILLEIGPSALGWRRAKEIEDRHSLSALTAALRYAADAGQIRPTALDVQARFLNVILAEAAFLYLEKGMAAQSDIEDALNRFFESLTS